MVSRLDHDADVRSHPMSTARWLLYLGLVAALCACKKAPATPPWASSMAVSHDRKLIYATDPDNDLVVVFKARTEDKLAQVKVGRDPERIALGSDGTIYVSNRGSRSVSVIRRQEWRESARIPVGLEPVGLAVSPDNHFLYVVNSTSIEDPENGTLVAIDLRTHQQHWALAIGPEPREIRLLGEHRASVLLHKDHALIEVDLDMRKIVSRRVLLSQR